MSPLALYHYFSSSHLFAYLLVVKFSCQSFHRNRPVQADYHSTMTSFQEPDPNIWYQITESLLGINSSLQYNGYVIYMGSTNPATNQFWQFFPSNNGSYQMREMKTTQQLTACYSAVETAAGKTRPCMMPTTNDATQEWELAQWADGTYKITNVANGTGYNMDCHPGNTLYMSPNVTEVQNEPGQHWEIKSLGDINDGTFSTAFPLVSSLLHDSFHKLY